METSAWQKQTGQKGIRQIAVLFKEHNIKGDDKIIVAFLFYYTVKKGARTESLKSANSFPSGNLYYLLSSKYLSRIPFFFISEITTFRPKVSF